MNYSKYNVIYRLQKWMDSVAGQTFLNYAYSWGASIVILGTLFKLTHMPSADYWLFMGMGTEVFVFFISAFDRPFDKTAEGMRLENSMSQIKEQKNGNETVIDLSVKKDINETLTAINKAYAKQLENVEEATEVSAEIEKQMKAQAYELMKLSETFSRINKAVGNKEH